ncbi:XdhC family protein [Luteimonas huabeiensis]|uniref:XdhC family protein n=1 Tax=Luteimonas huabeiensis TaxID=1244513 RepID=UPI0004659E35|nr:XdhC family protein [Luteimonas huabeiensis]
MHAPASAAAPAPRRGGRAGVVEALARSLAQGRAPVLAVVLETLGSTYARIGDFALFGAGDGPGAQAGWLSGGCLEPDIARHAARAAADGRVEWIEVDARDDEDVFSGGATGCRGRLRVALLPVARMPGWDALCAAWLAGAGPLRLTVDAAAARVSVWAGAQAHDWALAMPALPWARAGASRWTLPVPAQPAVRIHGAGPETPWLVPMLQATGWHVTVVEDRSRWLEVARAADALVEGPPSAGPRQARPAPVALVMHHNFERDREALEVLAADPAARFIGLLGPARRRDDLLRTLPARIVARLHGRLQAPVGLLATRGAEAISLSIALQLQAFLDAERAAAAAGAHAASAPA